MGAVHIYMLFAISIDRCAGSYEILAGALNVVTSTAGKGCDPILVRPDTLYHYYCYGGAY